MTDGNWIRFLLRSLMKVIRRRKSGGGTWDPLPLGQESYGSSAVEDGSSNNYDLSWNLSFGTSQIPRLEVRGIWGAFPSHWLICPKGLPLTHPGRSTKPPRTESAGLLPSKPPTPSCCLPDPDCMQNHLSAAMPCVPLSLPGICALSAEAKGKLIKDASPDP